MGKIIIIKLIIYIYENNGMKVILGVLIGRVVKRMIEFIGREVKIIYRFLEMGVLEEDELVFEKGELLFLDCDVIIIDEVLMIDIMFMYSLLKVINLGIRLIIVGDVD